MLQVLAVQFRATLGLLFVLIFCILISICTLTVMNYIFIALLSCLLFSASVRATETEIPASNSLPEITITVDANRQESVSHLQLGVTHTQRSLDTVANPDALALERAKTLLSRVATYQNVHIMGWGTENPNPAPGVYNWASLDRRMAMVRSIPGAIPVITLCAAPDWMKGGEAGKTNWKNIEVAPTPAHFGDFADLAATIARRYPDVLYFQVWNEMKGLWKSEINNWDYENYTALYNKCYRALKAVNPNIKVGGPYLVIEGTGNGKWPPNDATNAPLSPRNALVIDYWLANKVGADFIVLDRGLQSFHDKNQYTPGQLMSFTSQFGSIARQIRTKTALPIWWAEYYADIKDGAQSIAAAHAASLAQMASHDSSVALLWQPMDSGEVPAALISNVQAKNGGRALPLWDVYRIFHDDFPPGTPLVSAISSSPEVQVLASPERTLLINHSERTLIAKVNGVPYALGRYDVRSVPTPPQ